MPSGRLAAIAAGVADGRLCYAAWAESSANSTPRGLIRADRLIAADVLRSGAIVIVFPGGIYDAYRPTISENVIDFKGRTGYVRTALEANTPIVPVVSIQIAGCGRFTGRTSSRRSEIFVATASETSIGLKSALLPSI